MELVNLTPHAVDICDDHGQVRLTITANPTPARVVVDRYELPGIEVEGLSIPLHRTEAHGVSDLPLARPDTMFIVASAVAAASDRGDLIVPDELVRDDRGTVVGCRSFAVLFRSVDRAEAAP